MYQICDHYVRLLNFLIICISAVIEAKSFGHNLFYLVYSDPSLPQGYLYITAKGENQEIILSVGP